MIDLEDVFRLKLVSSIKMSKQLKISLEHQIFRPFKYYKVNNNSHKKPFTLTKAGSNSVAN